MLVSIKFAAWTQKPYITIRQFGNSAIRQFGNSAIRQFGNSAIRQFGNSLNRSLTLAFLLALPLSAALTVNTRAVDLYWGDLQTGGIWNELAAPWFDAATDTAADAAPGISGTTDNVTIGDGVHAITVDYDINGTNYTKFAGGNSLNVNTLTVDSGVTLNIINGRRSGFAGGIINAGLIQALAGRSATFAAGSGGLNTFNMTNTGTIYKIGMGSLDLPVSMDNTGGLVAVDNGGTIDFRGATGITGGTITVSAGAKVWASNLGTNMSLNNVNTTNAGYWEWFSNNANNQGRSITVSGGLFANSGTFILRQDTNQTANRSLLDLNVTNSGTFRNSGVLNIENIASGGPSASVNEGIYAQMNVATAAAEFTNSGLLTVYNNAIGSADPRWAQQAALTVANGNIFTNTGTISVSLGEDVTDDAQHYATLTVSTDWTNNGTIIIAGANKTTAKASLDLGDNNYTAGAGSVTVLVNDAQLKAASVTISGGTFDGAGKILAATTVGAGGVLDPDGTLTLSSLTLDDGGILNFSIADGDLLDITNDLTLSGATLLLTDSAFTEGEHLLANYGGILTGDVLTVSGLADYNYALDFGTDKQIFLNITNIPEPSTWALLLTGAALLAALRRRR
ncbi:MAG: PEP-CTERM sorting domain-containing protein [Verrucomicrobiales bacterium]|nr:PEP-CTERM sorting domain-containing protein [Verrucomicrobiales bacterium]